jgi:uncharacterized protein YbcI
VASTGGSAYNAGTSKRISHGVVAIYKEYLGRGPTTARTTISDNLVVTVLEDSLTKAERSLVGKGEADTVRSIRRRFQAAMSEDVTKLVEEVTGRTSRTMLSDHNVEEDIAVEMVVLEPARD